MNTLLVAITIGLVILVAVVACRLVLRDRWVAFHQRLVALSVFAFGMYLATLTGTVTQLVVPGIGAVGIGAAAGGAIGLVTSMVVGVVGVATGGVGLAIDAGAMALIGAGVGAAGGAASGFGFQVISYPLVSPFVWVPLMVLAVYLFVAVKRGREEPQVSPSPAINGTCSPSSTQGPSQKSVQRPAE